MKRKKVVRSETPCQDLLVGIQEICEKACIDAAKFEGGTNAAGTRVRGNAQTIKKMAQELRILVAIMRNERKE